VLALSGLVAGPAPAADKLLERSGDWEAIRASAGGEVFCLIAALPDKSEGKIAKRGEATLMVAHWPKKKAFGQVQAKTGFAIRKASSVDLVIDGKTFKLPADGDSGYGENAKANAELVAALKSGKSAVASATPAVGGAKITDTYSLEGFSKALAAIDKECRK
jgi:hypothetical protein